eukprot:SAG31_NODE_33954_length_338_cov_0.870293_1_plen_98_part_00
MKQVKEVEAEKKLRAEQLKVEQLKLQMLAQEEAKQLASERAALSQIKQELGQLRRAEPEPYRRGTDQVSVAAENQVRSYFLVFVPTIREIRDFYREM